MALRQVGVATIFVILCVWADGATVSGAYVPPLRETEGEGFVKAPAVDHGLERVETGIAESRSLSEHFAMEPSEECKGDLKLLESSVDYGRAYIAVTTAAVGVGDLTGRVCGSRTIDCEVVTPSSNGMPVPAKCCQADSLPLWTAVAGDQISIMTTEGEKLLPFPRAGVLWLGLSLQVRVPYEKTTTLYSMNWSHAIPTFFPASCFSEVNIGQFIASMNTKCENFSDANVACAYSLLQPV